jgi:hypothetical protein
MGLFSFFQLWEELAPEPSWSRLIERDIKTD